MWDHSRSTISGLRGVRVGSPRVITVVGNPCGMLEAVERVGELAADLLTGEVLDR
ncbi:MAG: hypothetical protein OXQ94_00955 [Gemmatimonadota bacterium]|nr:hypothetical protein [Gemmatimonadota bacterium]